MRSLWSQVGRIGCHCRCYTCLEEKHVLVRRMSSAIARVRSGQGVALLYGQLEQHTLGPVRVKIQARLYRPYFKRPKSLWVQANSEQATSSIDAQVNVEGAAKEKLGIDGKEVAQETIQAHKDETEPANLPHIRFEPGAVKSAYRRIKLYSLPPIQNQANNVRDTSRDNTMDEKKRNADLVATATELQSLTIGHWSLDDIVRYEPRPGGERPPQPPSTTSADPNFMPPQSPWAPDRLKRVGYASMWTKKKIAKMETGIAIFVVKICLLSDLNTQWPSNLIVLPEAFRGYARLTRKAQEYLLQDLVERMDMLRNKFGVVENHDPTPPEIEHQSFIPNYDQYEDGSHHEFLRDLNQSIVDLFKGYKQQQLTFRALLVKISHNLLVSSCPPNAQTMNILLLGFRTLERRRRPIAFLVMDYLIDICRLVKIRPNEITCATILACYRRRGMKNAFAEYVQLMRGTGKDALMFTNTLKLTNQNFARLVPLHNDPDRFKQAVYPSPMIFAEVIKGVLRFCSLRDAIDVCEEFAAQEWGYDWSCLLNILYICIVQRDWAAGLWVWRQVKGFRAAGYVEPPRIYAAMLALCVACKQDKMFEEILRYAMGQLHTVTMDQLVHTSTRMLKDAIDSMDLTDLYEATTAVGEKAAYEEEATNDPSTNREMLGIYGQETGELGPADWEEEFGTSGWRPVEAEKEPEGEGWSYKSIWDTGMEGGVPSETFGMAGVERNLWDASQGGMDEAEDVAGGDVWSDSPIEPLREVEVVTPGLTYPHMKTTSDVNGGEGKSK